MAAALLLLPLGPMLTWKRGDLAASARPLWPAAVLAGFVGLAVFFLTDPKRALASIGVGLGVWVIGGALAEVATRVRVGRASPAEAWRRARGLPRGAWGATLAHVGVGVFVLGACCETAWRVEAAATLAPGQSLRVGAYILRLEDVRSAEGPNFTADRASIRVRPDRGSAFVASPERRFYPANRQTTSHVALERRGTSDLYVVLGERAGGGSPAWTVRAFFNPLARLIFLGPLLMAAGGALSLSDRRLRLAAGAKAPRRASNAPLPAA